TCALPILARMTRSQIAPPSAQAELVVLTTDMGSSMPTLGEVPRRRRGTDPCVRRVCRGRAAAVCRRRSGPRVDRVVGRAGREDILLGVTTKSLSVTSSPVRALRSSLRLSVPLAVATAVLMATPAMADLPEAWETPETAGFLDHFILIAAVPVGVALVIALLTLLPSLARGEKL